MNQKQTLLIYTNNHFDPTWRRCFDRRVTFGGQEFVSYAELEDYYITDNLAIAAAHPRYAFNVESAVVLRKYLERHPERLAELRRLAQAGRFAVSGAGDNIIDSNMVLGESIIRNYLLGLLWVEETLGISTKLGIRNDAFGNSAQLPQILRGCEMPWVVGLSYSSPTGKFWRGLDGSAVCNEFLPIVGSGHTDAKYRPCGDCGGSGCSVCGSRGIDESFHSPLPDGVRDESFADYGAGCVAVTSEEALPNPGMVEWAKSLEEKYDIRFAIQEDAYPWVKRWIDMVDDPPGEHVHPSVELNPNNTGVFVSRIKTKQTCRRQEYALLGAETLAALAGLCGSPVDRRTLRTAWQELLFTMFHDAITSTHVDPCYDELQEKWRTIDQYTTAIRGAALGALGTPDDGTVSVINPFGQTATEVVDAVMERVSGTVALVDSDGREVPIVRQETIDAGETLICFVAEDVPALGTINYQVVPREAGLISDNMPEEPVIENGRFRIVADKHGITEVFDKKLGVVVAGAGEFRTNEIILERDEGSPWATLHPDRRRRQLACNTRLVSVGRGPAHQSMTFECSVPEWNICCDVRTTVTLYRNIERVDFVTEVDWDTFNSRIRVAFPIACSGRGIYGIPYGMIERQPYAPEFDTWAGANGDWPVVNWAGVEGDCVSVALLNKGLPSYTIETGDNGAQTMFLSILRSPNVPAYLHEPQSYVMTDYDGMRDAGSHRLEYSLTAYDVPFADSSVVSDSESYNAGLLAVSGWVSLPEVPRVESPSVRLSSFKRAEEGDALIIRLCEYRGRDGGAVVILPHSIGSVSRVNLLERQAVPLDIIDGKVCLELRPWELATLRLEVKG